MLSEADLVLGPRVASEQISSLAADRHCATALLRPQQDVGDWVQPAPRGHPGTVVSESVLGSGGLGTLARQAIPYTSCLTRVLTGPSPPVLAWGLGGQPPTPHAVPPVHRLHLSVAGPAGSSWCFRPRVGVAFLPLPIQLAAAPREGPPQPLPAGGHHATVRPLCGCRRAGSGGAGVQNLLYEPLCPRKKQPGCPPAAHCGLSGTPLEVLNLITPTESLCL